MRGILVRLFEQGVKLGAFPIGKGIAILGQIGDPRPDLLLGSAKLLEDLVQLINLRVAREKRSLVDHLSHDCAHGPHVDLRSILLRACKTRASPYLSAYQTNSNLLTTATTTMTVERIVR